MKTKSRLISGGQQIGHIRRMGRKIVFVTYSSFAPEEEKKMAQDIAFGRRW